MNLINHFTTPDSLNFLAWIGSKVYKFDMTFHMLDWSWWDSRLRKDDVAKHPFQRLGSRNMCSCRKFTAPHISLLISSHQTSQ